MLKGFVWAVLLAALGGAARADDAPQPAADRLVTKVYPVADLIVPWPAPEAAAPQASPPAVTPVQAAACPSAACAAATFCQTRPGTRENAAALARLIRVAIRPYSWAEMGGPGKIDFYEIDTALVVNNTADVQARVGELLATLRRMQEATTPHVQVEVKVVEVPDSFCERAGCDLGRRQAGGANPPVAFLTDAQAAGLLECVQGERRANVLCHPKLMLIDMQPGRLRVGETQRFLTGLELTAGPNGVERKPRYQTVDTGLTLTATPQVSADRKRVLLRLGYRTSQLGGPAPATAVKVGEETEVVAAPAVNVQEIRATVSLPDGGTALLAGPAVTREERFESRLPVLSNIPSMSRLAVNKGTVQATYQQLILVTAKVLAPEGGDCCHAAECKARPGEKVCCEKCATAKPACATCCADGEAAKLVAAYRKACAEGRTEEAMKLALQALARDPKCFAADK
jgi:hypothetical protein